MDVLLVRPPASHQTATKLAAENERLLRRFSSRAAPGSSFKAVPSLREAGLLYSVRARVMPTSSYRGDMEVAPNLRFKVRACLRRLGRDGEGGRRAGVTQPAVQGE